MFLEELHKIIDLVGRENLSIVLGFFLLKRLINGLIPSIERYIDVKISVLNFRMSGRHLKKLPNPERGETDKIL